MIAGGACHSHRDKPGLHTPGDFPFFVLNVPGLTIFLDGLRPNPAGRYSGFRIVLPTAPSQGFNAPQWQCAVFVLGYSGGPTPVSNRIPF